MKSIISKVFKGLNVFLVLFNFLMFFAMRPCWSGISSTLGYSSCHNSFLLILPVLVCVLLLLIMLSYIIIFALTLNKKEMFITNCIYLSINILFMIGIIVFFALGAIDYSRFILRNFFISLIPLAILLVLIFFIFFYPKTTLKDMKWFKVTIVSILVLCNFGYLFQVSIHKIEYEPVVYVVEDNYQIVFSSSCKSLGWVTIDGNDYYDLASGSQKSETKVHKIEVAQTILDSAKEYQIHSQSVLYRGPFYGYKGKTITKTYSFKPVDTSDGLQYFTMSDIHMGMKETLKTASYVENNDFIVFVGDTISMVDSYSDAQYINKIAYQITKGSIPVIYARGNHEVKGKYSEYLYQYVGSKNEKFFYKFHLANIYGLVLDLGEDHDDDWWEYYGTAEYQLYQQEQLELLQDEVNSKDYENYDYRMVVSHIPPNYINTRKNHYQIKQDMTTLLNQLDIDLCLTGHQHQVLLFEPNTLTPLQDLTYNPDYRKGKTSASVTDYKYPTIMIGKRGLTQNDSADLTKQKSQICAVVSVNLSTRIETVSYINSLGKKLNIVNPFANYTYGEDIIINLDTKEFTKR